MAPEAIRRTVLGSLRYGKPLIFDLNDVPMISIVQDFFNVVSKMLWGSIMDKTIKNKEVFTKHIKQPGDGEAYLERNFTQDCIDAMIVVFLTSAVYVEDELLAQFTTFVIPPPEL